MRITPLEIRQHTFDKTFRGYDAESVDAFLLSLSQEWERVAEELRQSKHQLEVAEREVSRMKEIETSLFKTLKIAETTQQEINEKTQVEANKTLAAAKLEAEKVLQDARKKADMNIIDSENKAQFILNDAVSDLRHFERDFKAMERYKDHLVHELKNFANETLDKVQSFEERINSKLKESQAQTVVTEIPSQEERVENQPVKPLVEEVATESTPEINLIDHQTIEIATPVLAQTPIVEDILTNEPLDDYDDEIGELPSVHAILASEGNPIINPENIPEIADVETNLKEEKIVTAVLPETIVPSKLNKLTIDNDGTDLGLPTVSSLMNELTKENLTNGGGFVNNAASFFDDL